MPAKTSAMKGHTSAFAAVNKELWLLLSIFLLAALVNNVVASQQIVLGLYMLPTLFSAYFYGRRHAVLTAVCSIALVVLVSYFHSVPSNLISVAPLQVERWMDLAAWAGILMITGYTMGLLCERLTKNVDDLRDSYEGMVVLLQQLISNSKLSQNSRLALCATKIAESMGLPFERMEDIRAAALLEDLEKSGVGLDLFMKAAGLDRLQAEAMDERRKQGKVVKSSTLTRAIPILMAFHDGRSGKIPDHIPIEAQVLMLASLYDTGSQGTRLSPLQVIEKIAAQKQFDGDVVEGFKHAFV